MPLSPEEERLFNGYDDILQEFSNVFDPSKNEGLQDAPIPQYNNFYESLTIYLGFEHRALWAKRKEDIVRFCVNNDIRLYNINFLKHSVGAKYLSDFVAHFSMPNPELRQRRLLSWKEEFEKEIAKAQVGFVREHEQGHLTVLDQYRKTGTVSSHTLLTMKDMTTLLANSKHDPEVLITNPIEISRVEDFRLRSFLTENKDNDKTIFLPINEQGHWFYLLRKEGNWTLHDSRPLQDDELSATQVSILSKSQALLTDMLGKNTPLDFHTTEKQLNDYDCGTQVINAYREITDSTYVEKEHSDSLLELLAPHLPEQEFHFVKAYLLPNANERIIAEASPIVEEAAAVAVVAEELPRVQLTPQEEELIDNRVEQSIALYDNHEEMLEKTTLYRQHLVKLVSARGLFAVNKDNKLDMAALEAAKDDNESNDEYAERLQEAEFRKAGL